MRNFSNDFEAKTLNGLSFKVKTTLKGYANLLVKIYVSNFFLTFMQSLWDKVYNLADIRYSCKCEFSVKSPHNKMNKKYHKNLRLAESKLVVQKLLKKINIEVNQLKKEVQSDQYVLKNLKSEIWNALKINTISKEDFETRKEYFVKWINLQDDQRHEFRKKQEQLAFSILLDESNLIKGKIIEIIHSYHIDILSNGIQYIDKEEFESKKIELKANVTSIFKFAITYIKQIYTKLGIKETFLKDKFKIAQNNEIFVNMILNIYRQKNNLVLVNIFKQMSRNDIVNFVKTSENFLKLFPKITVTFLLDDIKYVPNFNDNLFYETNKKLKELHDKARVFEKNISNINDFFKNKNTISYELIKPYKLRTSFGIIDTKKEALSKGTLFLNPFNFSVDKFKKDDFLVFDLKLIKDKEFADTNFHLGITKNAVKIYFYTDVDLGQNLQQTVYIKQDDVVFLE